MSEPFLFKLVLSFVAGGAWTTVSTIIGERAGTKAGGVIAGLPSTAVVAFFFIGWTLTPELAAEATTLVPLVLGIAAVYVVVYVLLYPHGFALALSGALGVWFLIITALILTKFESFAGSLIGLVLLVAAGYYVLEERLRVPSVARRPMHYTRGQLAFRALLGGLIIAFAVAVARVGGPLIGGIFATFPAMFLSTMVINHFAQGRAYATAFLKTMMVSGTINTSIYAVAVRYFYPTLGLLLGTLLAFVVALASGYGTYQFVRHRMS